MADNENPIDGDQEEAPKKRGKTGLLIGIVLALALGAGGFYAVYSGLILGVDHATDIAADAHDGETLASLEPVAFVPLEPLVISLGNGERNRHLRFRAELEVVPGTQAEVTTLAPRVMDVLNSYLRAVDLSDLEDPAALINLRAQMLRRIQLVAGEGRVRDLLIIEFVLN